MSHEQKVKVLPWWGGFVAAGAAASWAEVVTIPLDTCKVRLQIQASLPKGDVPKYKGMFHTFTTVMAEEGPQGLWKGLVPGLLRQCVFGTLRIGLYDHVKNFYHSEKTEIPLYKKILAGLTTGTIGISIASPTDLLKVRLQAEGRLPPNVPRRYKGTLDAFGKIYREEGITGFWKGVGPNIVRNATINAAELATYDQVKQTVMRDFGFKDNIYTHLFCGTTAGFVATCFGSPADVIKTRIMNQKVNADGSKTYRSFLHAFFKILKEEGPYGLYKGFIPNFARIGTWNIVMFLTLEQIKARLF